MNLVANNKNVRQLKRQMQRIEDWPVWCPSQEPMPSASTTNHPDAEDLTR